MPGDEWQKPFCYYWLPQRTLRVSAPFWNANGVKRTVTSGHLRKLHLLSFCHSCPKTAHEWFKVSSKKRGPVPCQVSDVSYESGCIRTLKVRDMWGDHFMLCYALEKRCALTVTRFEEAFWSHRTVSGIWSVSEKKWLPGLWALQWYHCDKNKKKDMFVGLMVLTSTKQTLLNRKCCNFYFESKNQYSVKCYSTYNYVIVFTRPLAEKRSDWPQKKFRTGLEWTAEDNRPINQTWRTNNNQGAGTAGDHMFI